MSCRSVPKVNHSKKNLPYIDPSIRAIIGSMLITIAVILYFDDSLLFIFLIFLLFMGANLVLSVMTKFCILEKMLRLLGFRSELDEIKLLSEETQRAASIQKNYMKTLNMLNEAVLEVSPEGEILSASDGWHRLIGHDAGALSHVHNEDKPLLQSMLEKIVNTDEKVHRVRFRFLAANNTEHWIGGKFMLEKLGENAHIRGVLRDITDAYLQEKQITHMAMHDALTGLPNRMLLDERMEQALAQAKRHEGIVGILFIDLDNFKQVNDIHGHKTGDHLLVSVSKIMQQRLRATDTLARWGGDEFVVLLPELKRAEDVADVAKTLMHQLENELIAEEFDAIVTLSIGCAVYPDDADSAETLLVQADKALYFAKEQGRNNVQIYTKMRDSQPGFYDFDMTNRFSQAIKEGLIQVHFQPIVSSTDRKICGFEALARWHDEKYGWVSPGVFIPMAENLGLIQDLGKQVMEKALESFSSQDRECQCDLVLSVNLSNRQLMHADFNSWITALVDEYGLKPHQLKLEITESLALVGIERAKEVLETLRVTGFLLSLDDFGTGYSSLSLLHNLPVHELKIDMSFVRRFENQDGHIMLEAITSMGRSLGLELVAEGVETAECVQAMSDLGVEKLQGYYFSKPLPWEEVAKLYVSCSDNFSLQVRS